MAFRDPNAPVISRLFGTDVKPNPRIEIDSYRSEGVTSGGQIRFYLDNENGFLQATRLEAVSEGLDPVFDGIFQINGPNRQSVTPAIIQLAQFQTGASQILIQGTDQDVNGDGGLVAGQPWRLAGEQWNALTLSSTWVPFTAGTNDPVFSKDSAGRVSVRGRVKDPTPGNPNVVGVLPVGYRPSATEEYALKSGNDVATISWVQVLTNGNINVASNTVAAKTLLSLSLSFSTLP